MRSRLLSTLLPVFAALGALLATGCKKTETASTPPDVEVMVAQASDVPIVEEWIGSLTGFVNAEIHAQVAGYLTEQSYREGAPLKKGDLLFQIDPRPFKSALDQVRAKLEQDKALEGKTALDVKRYTPLAKEQAVSQEELDNAVQANLAAKAQVKADEAAIENAQLNLEFTRVTSPIDGLSGIALAQIGNLVSPSTGVLTTVSTVDPIKVYFSINERSYLSYWREQVNQGATNLDLEIILADGSPYPIKGHLFFADRQIDPTMGTLQLVGLVPNPKYLLRPGQYARVRAQTHIHNGAILLPQRAVAELQGAYQVTLVDNENKAHTTRVQVGPQVGPNWIIESGIKPGDKVVIEGLQKAKNGEAVNPRPYAPKSS